MNKYFSSCHSKLLENTVVGPKKPLFRQSCHLNLLGNTAEMPLVTQSQWKGQHEPSKKKGGAKSRHLS